MNLFVVVEVLPLLDAVIVYATFNSRPEAEDYLSNSDKYLEIFEF